MARYLKWVFGGVALLIAVLVVIVISKNGVPSFGTSRPCDVFC